MTNSRRCPAVWAGLAGAATLSAPAPAVAATLASSLSSPLSGSVAPFAFGCATGAVMGLAAGYLVTRSRRPRGAHAGGRVEVREVSNEPEVTRRAAEAAAVAADAPRAPRHARPAGAPAPGRAERPAADAARKDAPRAAAHAASDYADIAENYVRRASIVERMATRARGVASVLGDRLGASMMDGVPVIERADGSVGDVGTTWWSEAVGDAMVAEAPLAPEEPTAPAAPAQGAAPAPRRDVSGRLADIDLGMFPERRAAEELDSEEDLWQVALDALDEQVAQQAPLAFEDVVGGGDTLDEPDGLEAATSFIPFRTPAGHPEVVDTESYVDYLISDEFSRNASSSALRNAREYLHVIEGGSLTASLAGRSCRPRRGSYRPRHMASVACEA